MSTAEKYLKPEVIRQIKRLDLRAQFIVKGFLSGLHASPFHGFSVEFSEHRKYVPGDDLRLIDWAVFAKTDRFYIRKFEAETNLAAYLLVDTSASMAYPEEGGRSGGAGTADTAVAHAGSKVGETPAPQRMSKLEYAICLAAALGYMMIGQQ